MQEVLALQLQKAFVQALHPGVQAAAEYDCREIALHWPAYEVGGDIRLFFASVPRRLSLGMIAEYCKQIAQVKTRAAQG
ncbi:MAG: hypothetical protein ACOCUB_02750 [Desulfohalobiaceae bacterium]